MQRLRTQKLREGLCKRRGAEKALSAKGRPQRTKRPDAEVEKAEVRQSLLEQPSAKRGVGRFGSELPQAVIKELLEFPRSQFVVAKEFDSLEAALASGPGLLDLFAGSRGLSKACCRAAPIWSLTFDISHSPSEDLLVLSLQNKVTKLVRAGAFFAMVAGPVCSSFSSAITPPTRTLLHPAGVPWASELQAFKK